MAPGQQGVKRESSGSHDKPLTGPCANFSRPGDRARGFPPFWRIMKRAFLPLFLACLPLQADWPQWRGPDGQGHAPGKDLPTAWGEADGVAWRTELPGRGWSSPVISDGRVWMTTAIETPASEEETRERLRTNTGDQPLTLLSSVELRALCVEAATGKLLHNVLLFTRKDPQWVHQLNSYASPTPVLAGGHLFCHFGSLGSACLRTSDASLVWTRTDAELEVMHENGPGSTPVVHGNLMIFHLDGSDRQFIVALDTATGKTAWKTERSGSMHDNPQLRKSYGTPLVAETAGRTQLLSQGSNWLYSYDPASGRELWKYPFGELGFSITPRPVFHDGVVYFATGFGRSRLIALRISGGTPELLWTFDKGAPTQPSPVLADGLLYFANDGGMVTCVDAKDGSEVFRDRLGEPFSASPMAHGDRIYFPGREGTTYILRKGREFAKIASPKLPGRQFASFAAEGATLFVRTDSALYALRQPEPAP